MHGKKFEENDPDDQNSAIQTGKTKTFAIILLVVVINLCLMLALLKKYKYCSFSKFLRLDKMVLCSNLVRSDLSSEEKDKKYDFIRNSLNGLQDLTRALHAKLKIIWKDETLNDKKAFNKTFSAISILKDSIISETEKFKKILRSCEIQIENDSKADFILKFAEESKNFLEYDTEENAFFVLTQMMSSKKIREEEIAKIFAWERKLIHLIEINPNEGRIIDLVVFCPDLRRLNSI